MIAKSFIDYDIKNVCVFASGVSNSLETDPILYDKELLLLKDTINNNKDYVILYFSTLGVHRSTKSLYTDHKLKVECYIKKTVSKYVIIRLPNVVGKNHNDAQLLPYLYNKLLKKEKLLVSFSCVRDLIDVQDIPKISKYLVENKMYGIHNISLNNSITIFEILNAISNRDIKTNTNIVDTNKFNYLEYPKDINYTNVVDAVPELNINPINIIKKYYKL